MLAAEAGRLMAVPGRLKFFHACGVVARTLKVGSGTRRGVNGMLQLVQEAARIEVGLSLKNPFCTSTHFKFNITYVTG